MHIIHYLSAGESHLHLLHFGLHSVKQFGLSQHAFNSFPCSKEYKKKY